jgi:hypothetical protein
MSKMRLGGQGWEVCKDLSAVRKEGGIKGIGALKPAFLSDKVIAMFCIKIYIGTCLEGIQVD